MSSGKKVLIIANGERVRHAVLKKQATEADYIIAADGGIATCIKYGIKPDCVIGDLDSFDRMPQKDVEGVKILRINDQDTTDVQKAISYAQSLNPDRIDMYCVFGKRVDHTIANIFILHNYTDNTPLYMHEDFGHLAIIFPGTTYIKNAVGQTVSVFSLDQVSGLHLDGFEFAIEKSNITPGFIGVSNKIIKSKASISFDSGRLLFYRLEREN